MISLVVFLNLAMAHSYCTPDNEATQSLQQIQDGLSGSQKDFCADLQRISKKQKPVHQPLCKALWDDGKSWWKKIAEEKPAELDKSSEKYQNPSRNEMLKNGFAVATVQDLKNTERKFNEVKNRTASQCCGSDKHCLEAFKATTLQFCSDPVAEKDPNVPDPCAGTAEAYFSVNEDNYTKSYYAGVFANTPASEKTEFLKQVRATYSDFNPGKIYSGYISLGKYKRGETQELDYTIRHELGHACNYVRLQIGERSGTSLSTANGAYEGFCGHDPVEHYNYTVIDNLLAGRNASALKQCMRNKVEKETFDANDYAFIKDSCFGSKTEEALADVFSALTVKESEMPNLTMQLCFNSPSAIHSAGHSTLDCVINHAPGYATELSKGLSCTQ